MYYYYKMFYDFFINLKSETFIYSRFITCQENILKVVFVFILMIRAY